MFPSVVVGVLKNMCLKYPDGNDFVLSVSRLKELASFETLVYPGLSTSSAMTMRLGLEANLETLEAHTKSILAPFGVRI